MNNLLDGSYRFENFVIGSSNRLAASAAQAVADAPGHAYNPLFVYGQSGLGKTHLVAAIACHARIAAPDLRVELCTGEELAEQLHHAIATGQQELFTKRYQQVDLLILDDVQFLAGQRETQSELLRLFNVMQADGRQLVMTSDRPPSEIPDVDQRLVSRLSGGLIVDVGVPDYEMRLAILRNACTMRTLDLNDDVLDEVARLAFSNVRELKGALNKLTAYQQLDGHTIAASDVRAVLGSRSSIGNGATSQLPEPAMARSGELRGHDNAEYDGFLADVLQEVETRVERWRVVLGEACAFWRAEGYITSVLERAMSHPVQPDVNGLLSTFTAAIEHLRTVEAQVIALDPAARGHAAFRNPEMIGEAQRLLDRAIATALPLPSPIPSLTRDTLEVGSANQLAMRAFDAVCEHPGTRYNPLLLHGASGVGKTHYLHALGNALRTAWPSRTVACLSATAFADDFVVALQEGHVERWRARYRAADILILDDVQSLAAKERTQEELFHLFNHVYDRGGQIVLACDRPPRELTQIADRLRSRFEGGLVVALPAPDRALREKLVHRWLCDAGAEPISSLVSFLADQEVSSIRELGGMFKRVLAAADLHGFSISLESAQRALGIEPVRHARIGMSVRDSYAGAAGAVDAFFLDREKTIWEWPDIGGRVIEELR